MRDVRTLILAEHRAWENVKNLLSEAFDEREKREALLAIIAWCDSVFELVGESVIQSASEVTCEKLN